MAPIPKNHTCSICCGWFMLLYGEPHGDKFCAGCWLWVYSSLRPGSVMFPPCE